MATIIMNPMKLAGETHVTILRNYYRKGVNGKLYIDGVFHSYCIELPWKENKPKISCIPEGKYTMSKRWSKKFGYHLLIHGIADRDLILMHPANDAIKELQGCIAPVTMTTGEGRGVESKKAFNSLKEKLYAALDEGEKVVLTITSAKTILKGIIATPIMKAA